MTGAAFRIVPERVENGAKRRIKLLPEGQFLAGLENLSELRAGKTLSPHPECGIAVFSQGLQFHQPVPAPQVLHQLEGAPRCAFEHVVPEIGINGKRQKMLFMLRLLFEEERLSLDDDNGEQAEKKDQAAENERHKFGMKPHRKHRTLVYHEGSTKKRRRCRNKTYDWQWVCQRRLHLRTINFRASSAAISMIAKGTSTSQVFKESGSVPKIRFPKGL